MLIKITSLKGHIKDQPCQKPDADSSPSPQMLFPLLYSFSSCPFLSAIACWHLHYCIIVIWLFILLKIKVLEVLGPYLARIPQCMAHSRHSASLEFCFLELKIGFDIILAPAPLT